MSTVRVTATKHIPWLLCALFVSANASEAYADDSAHDDTIEILDTADRNAVSSEHIDTDDIAAIVPRSAESVLSLVSGLQLIQHGSAGKGLQLLLRGYDAQHGADFAISANGVPLNEWSNIHGNGYLDLAIIPPEVIRAVDVDKGPFAIDAGLFAVAGSARYSLGASPAALGTSHSIGSNQRGGVRVASVMAPTSHDGDAVIAFTSDAYVGFGERRRGHRGTGFVKWPLLRRERLRVDSWAAASVGRFALPTVVVTNDYEQDVIDFDGSYQDDLRGRAHRALASVSANYRSGASRLSSTVWGGYRSLDLVENFTGFLIRDTSDTRRQSETRYSAGASFDLRRDLSRAWHLHVGASSQVHALAMREQALDTMAVPIAVNEDLNGVQGEGAAHAGVTYIGDFWSLDVGARATYIAFDWQSEIRANGDATALGLAPRARLTIDLAKAATLQASYGYGLRPGAMRSLSGLKAAGLQELDSTAAVLIGAHTGEIGVKVASENVAANVSGFISFLDNEFAYDHVSATGVEQNASRRLGGEVSLAFKYRDWLQFRAGAAYVDARFRNSGTPIPFIPRFSTNLFMQVRPSARWSFATSAQFFGQRQLPFGALSRANLFWRSTVTWAANWGAVSFAVDNPLGLETREGEYFYASHWRVNQTKTQLPKRHHSAATPRTLWLQLTWRP